jgi:hypothetical protein
MASKKTPDDAPPRGRAVTHAEADAAVAAARSAPAPAFAMAAADLGPRAPLNTFDEAAPISIGEPSTAFGWLDRGWRPMLGVVCGVGFFYSFVAAPVTDRREVDEAKLWVLCTLALGLAGTKTAERIGPGMMGRAQGLLGGPPLVTR